MSKARMLTLLPAFLVTLMLVTPSLARQKLEATGNCACLCTAGPTGLIYPPIGAECSVYDGHTCNVYDPATGGVRSGRLIGCDAEMRKVERVVPKNLQKLQPVTPYKRPGAQPRVGIQQQ